MFYLSLLVHTFSLPPRLLGLPLDEAIKMELESLFLDKVISNLGLCVSVYDIKSLTGGFVMPGDGLSIHTVELRMVMFRPFVGECITAKLIESDHNGLRCMSQAVSLGFFDDIYIPDHLVGCSTHFEAEANSSNRGIWIWTYEGNRFPIDDQELIRFRVQNVTYPPVPLAQPENGKPFAPMVITGTLEPMDGLGAPSWWDEDEDAEAAARNEEES